jgi:hypothetical protein
MGMTRHHLVAAAVALGVALAGALAGASAFRAGSPAPEIAGAPWINSEPLTTGGLRGHVVLVEFWTFG